MTYYGQFETDKVIETYFPDKNDGICIEVGAYDGIKGSNTKLFEDKGWYALCIEPNPYIYKELRSNRQHTIQTACDVYLGVSDLEIFDFKSDSAI